MCVEDSFNIRSKFEYWNNRVLNARVMRTASVPSLYCREVRCGGNCSSRLSWSSVWHGPRGTRLRRRCLLFGGARNGLTVQRAVLRPHGLSGHVSDQIEISPLLCLPLLAHSTTSPPPPYSI
ncbi:unnamed protein product [Euphydryas editha]|uniref:Uncharacterized protein n=1 Tax=Euphydryas editha TaxID=104508 RepID=A0AAU9V2T7_EUPED|nr:unnamed protein product [Euphydryas editha]